MTNKLKKLNKVLLVASLFAMGCSGEQASGNDVPYKIRPTLTSHDETTPIDTLKIGSYDIDFFMLASGNDEIDTVVIRSTGNVHEANPLDNVQERNVHTTLETFLSLAPERPVPAEFIDLHDDEAQKLERSNEILIPNVVTKQAITQAEANRRFAVGTDYTYHDISPQKWSFKNRLQLGSSQGAFSGFYCTPGDTGVSGGFYNSFPRTADCNNNSNSGRQSVASVNNSFWSNFGSCKLKFAPGALTVQFFYAEANKAYSFFAPITLAPDFTVRNDYASSSKSKRMGVYTQSIERLPCHEWFIQTGLADR
jgi:hypothetical protein